MDSISRESSFLSQGTLETVMSGVMPSELEMVLKTEQLYGVGDCLHEEATYCVESGQEMHALHFGDLPDSTQRNALTPVISPVSTSTLPSMEDYPGPYSFDIELNKSADDKTKWEHSEKLNKLFVVMNTKIPLKYKVKNSMESGLFVRVLPIFLAQDSFAEPVKRCPTHLSHLEKSNEGFLHVDHIIRCYHQAASYHKNPESARLSVVVPTEPPQPGCDSFTVIYSFMCKNSCGLGMNRRNTALIFTLERQNGEVIGRKVLNVRICSCPRRDKSKEESDQIIKIAEAERLIKENHSFDKKTVTKKPIKRLTNELVNVRMPKKYLKTLLEILLLNKMDRELSEEENALFEDINKHLH